jgi:lipopolysaccharide exporter
LSLDPPSAQPPEPVDNTARPVRNLGRKVAAGAVWAMAYKLLERGLGIISTLILARLLMPSDFGLVAIATSFIALIELIRLFGFESALIQLRHVTKAHFDTAWTFAASLGLAIATLVVVLAPWIAEYYADPRLQPVLWALALAAAFNGLESNGPVMFRKDLQWKQDFLFQATRKMAAVLIMIPLAFWLRNYWALVWGTVAGRFASLVVSYLITPHRPRFTLAAKADLWNFSKWIFLNNILAFLRQRMPNLMLGKIASATDVGFFAISRDISRLPTTELSAPINRAAFPGYAKISNDLPRLREGFLKLLGAAGIVVVPAGIGIAVTAELLIRVFLGERWLPAAPTMAILGLYGAIGGLQSNGMAVYLAIGKPRLQFLMQSIFIGLLLPAVYLLTTRLGHVGTALGYLVAGAIAVPINLANLCHVLGMPALRFLGSLWRTFLAAALMAAATMAVRYGLGEPQTAVRAAAHLATAVAAGAVTYCAALFTIWRLSGRPDGAETWLLDMLGKRLKRRFPAVR